MGVDYYIALFCLSEYLGELNNRKAFRINDIPSYISGANGRKLIDIPHKNKPRSCGNRL